MLNHLLIFDALLIDDALGDWIHCSHKGTSIPASCIDRTARKCIHKHKHYKLSSASTKKSKGTQTHLVFASFALFFLQCKQEQHQQIFVFTRFIYLQNVHGNLHCKQKILVASTKRLLIFSLSFHQSFSLTAMIFTVRVSNQVIGVHLAKTIILMTIMVNVLSSHTQNTK